MFFVLWWKTKNWHSTTTWLEVNSFFVQRTTCKTGYLLWVQQVQSCQLVPSLQSFPICGIRWILNITHWKWECLHCLHCAKLTEFFATLLLEVITYSGAGQTLHATESSVSLVSSFSSLTSLSSVSLCTSWALNGNNGRSTRHLRFIGSWFITRLQQYLKYYAYWWC